MEQPQPTKPRRDTTVKRMRMRPDLQHSLSRGVIIAGASSHPGKFGFVALHNLLSAGYTGAVAATNLEGGTVLGIETGAQVIEACRRHMRTDLVVRCTPARNPDLLPARKRGVRANAS